MNTLTLYSPTLDYSAITRADLQPSTKVKYQRAIDLMMTTGIDPFDFPSLQAYADSLSSSGRSFLKAALKIMTDGELTRIKAGATPENISAIQALVARLEAMDETIKVHQVDRERTPHWLSQQQVNQLTAAALSNKRDYIVLAVLLGAGLRREELENLTFDSLSQISNKDVLSIRGKGDKVRTIQISSLLASHLREWKSTIGGGRVARSINKAGTLGESLSTVGIFGIVRKYGNMIGIDDLDPHDCRRSYGRLIYEATRDIVRVMTLLGHKDVKTTQKYIGLDIKLDLEESAFPINGDYVMSVSGD